MITANGNATTGGSMVTIYYYIFSQILTSKVARVDEAAKLETDRS